MGGRGLRGVAPCARRDGCSMATMSHRRPSKRAVPRAATRFGRPQLAVVMKAQRSNGRSQGSTGTAVLSPRP